jgi:hypothetical protein
MGASQSSSPSPSSPSPSSSSSTSLSPSSPLSLSPSKSALCNFSANQITRFKEEISKLDGERSEQKLDFAAVITPLSEQLAADGVNVTNLEREMNINRHALLKNEMITKHDTIVNAILYSELISILKGYNVFLVQFTSICKTCNSNFNFKEMVERYLTPVLTKARFFIEDYIKGGELGLKLKNRYVSVTEDFLNNFDTEDPAKTIEDAIKKICAAKGAAVDARNAAKQGGNKRPRSISRSQIRLHSKIKTKTKRHRNKSKKQ